LPFCKHAEALRQEKLGIPPSLCLRLMIGGIADEPYYLQMCEDAGIWRSGGGDRQMPAEPHWIFLL